MTIDILFVAVVLLYGFFGSQTGAIRQLVHWLGLLLAYAAARPAATRATPYTAADLALSPAVVNVLLSGLFFFVFYLFASWIVRVLLQKIFRDHQNGPGDRAFGFALGAAKGAALLYALASFYVFFEGPLTASFGVAPPAVRRSAAIAFARRHDLFDAVHVPALAKIEKLIAASKSPGGAGALSGQPELLRLLEDPKVRAALKDQSLVRALESGDLSALKSDPRLQALFKSPKSVPPQGTTVD